jgi:tetratricopeptide (TPR) repeat protein
MKCHFKILLIAWLALALACVLSTAVSCASSEPQGQEADAQAPEVVPEYSQEEYDCYDAAVKEPDSLKRGKMLIQFIDKYAKSKLMPHIDAAYKTLLFDCSTAKKFQELEILGEQWLTLHPNNIDTLYYIAEASEKLSHDEKCIQCLLEIYKIKPAGDLAREIVNAYLKIKNIPKFLEWTETIFKYPEFNGDFGLRWYLVNMYLEKDRAKASEYAKETLKSISLVKDPSAETEELIRDYSWRCHDIIGINLIQQKKYAEAIAHFEQALKVKEYSEAHYNIALCLRNQGKIDDGIISYAKAELLGGEVAPKAKENLEKVYRSIHNGNLTGIEKTYNKAKEAVETSISLIKQPREETEKQMRDISWRFHDIIGRILIQQDNFAEAITSFQQALKAKEYGEAYYYIALCMMKQNKINDAMISYAKAELLGGEIASKAKEDLEQLFKSIHKGNLTGIEKIYEKAREKADTAQIAK